MATRRVQADTTRRAILDAGLALLSEKDASHVSVAEIMKRCGLSTGLFYHYYESKDQFIVSLITENWDSLREILEDPEIPFIRRLREYCLSLTQNFEKMNPQLRRNLNAYRVTDAYTRERELLYEDDAMYSWIRDHLENCVEKGYFSSDLPAEFIAKLIVYVVNGIDFNAALYKREWHDQAWVSQLFDFIEEDLLKPYQLKA